jgi:hypothetical protein
MTDRLPTPAEVFAAMSEAAAQIEAETGLFIPAVALRERTAAILYRQDTNEENRDAA